MDFDLQRNRDTTGVKDEKTLAQKQSEDKKKRHGNDKSKEKQ